MVDYVYQFDRTSICVFLKGYILIVVELLFVQHLFVQSFSSNAFRQILTKPNQIGLDEKDWLKSFGRKAVGRKGVGRKVDAQYL